MALPVGGHELVAADAGGGIGSRRNRTRARRSRRPRTRGTAKNSRHHQRGGADQRCVLQPGHLADLLDDAGPFGLKDGEEEAVGTGGRGLGEDGGHVGVALGDGEAVDLPAELLKRVGEGGDRARGVGVAVVDGRYPAQPELVVGEAGRGQPSVQGVVGDPVEAGAVVGTGIAVQVRGEGGGDDGGRYGHQAGVADHRGEAGGGHRAGRSDDADHSGVSGRGGGRGPAAGFGALRVDARPHRHRSAGDGAVVLNGQGHAPLAGSA